LDTTIGTHHHLDFADDVALMTEMLY